jgi:hypothetical protein
MPWVQTPVLEGGRETKAKKGGNMAKVVGSVPTQQAWGPECKLQYHQKII